MHLTLFLLTKKGYDCLITILKNSDYVKMIDQVVVARDKGNKEDYFDEIVELCENNSITCFERKENFKNNSHYSLAIGWKWLIHNANNLIVIHDSLLPKYRGFSPLVNMLINGEKKIGATAIYASEKMDEGDIILQKEIEIAYPLKIRRAIDLMGEIYANLTITIFEKLRVSNGLPRKGQNHSRATYSLWRNEDDYSLDWSKDAKSLERFVNAVGYPYGGAKTSVDRRETIRIIEVESRPELIFELDSAGKIFMYENGCPIVACGIGAIKILEAIDENGEPYEFTKLRSRLS